MRIATGLAMGKARGREEWVSSRPFVYPGLTFVVTASMR